MSEYFGEKGTVGLNLIFVYGTLKQGHSRNHLLKDQRYLGVARTVKAYRLLNFATYPGLMIDSPGKSVWGELYEVDDHCLVLLDEVEGVDADLYARHNVALKKIQLVNLPKSNEVFLAIRDKEAITYLYQQEDNGSDCGEFWSK